MEEVRRDPVKKCRTAFLDKVKSLEECIGVSVRDISIST
jgi:hypothetical protein